MNRTVAEMTLSEFRRIGEEAAKKAVADLRSAGLLDREPAGSDVDRPPNTGTTVERVRTKRRAVKLVEYPLLGLLTTKKSKKSFRKIDIKRRKSTDSTPVKKVEKEKA